ncbi:MAG TPA: hypothetical protein VHX61_16260 [Rhizomicrobium sp.]|jgi:hypothetical protein|nr:hypothetical protein [Rhizomicrobium sp.]
MAVKTSQLVEARAASIQDLSNGFRLADTGLSIPSRLASIPDTATTLTMRADSFDFISNFSTLWQVILGACLATAGGLVANQLEWRVQTQRRERNAALLFGEVLTSAAVVLDYAHDRKQVGEPFGPITLRMLRSARREIEIYERNRENLIDLRDAGLRARIHGLAIRLAMPLDGIADASQEIDALERQARSRALDELERKELEEKLAVVKGRREAGYDYIRETAAEIRQVLADLSPLAGHSFKPEAYVAPGS